MTSYYYLIASLPELNTDEDMPLSYEEFLKCCHSNVSEEKYELLENLTLDSTEGPLMDEWGEFYGMLIKELGYQRSVNLGKSYSASYGKDAAVSQTVSAALAAKNPLEAENILLRYEFETLDLLVGQHMFDDYVLFGYAIKLKLLERMKCFEQEKGKAEFDSLFEGIQKRVYGL